MANNRISQHALKDFTNLRGKTNRPTVTCIFFIFFFFQSSGTIPVLNEWLKIIDNGTLKLADVLTNKSGKIPFTLGALLTCNFSNF